MRTGKDLILATKPFAVDSTPRSWWCILSTCFLLTITLFGAGPALPITLRIVSSVLSGLLLLRLFVLYHDQQHNAILPHSRLAKWFMRIIGILLLSPSSVWNSSHNHHHNHNSRLKGSGIGSFPVMTTDQWVRTSSRDRAQYLFMRHPATILFGYVFIFLFGMCLAPFLNSPARHVDSLIALILHAAIAVGMFFVGGLSSLFLAMIIPSFIACAMGSYLFYAQHNFPGVIFQSKDGWTYERAALESSSYLVTGRVMGWFTANIGFHHIHHLNSRIPFYRLPEVMRALPELQKPRTTSLHLRDILACLRLKLWDVETQTMVPVPQ
jgi:omega-6 fatty acid desaturase (delta-12 desaturase)